MHVYTTSSNAASLTVSKLERTATLVNKMSVVKKDVDNAVKKEVKQVAREGGSTTQDRDTQRVTSTTARTVVPIATAVGGSYYMRKAIETLDRKHIMFDRKMDELMRNGDWAKLEKNASDLAISINPEAITFNTDALGNNFKTLNLRRSDPRQYVDMFDRYRIVAKHQIKMSLPGETRDERKQMLRMAAELRSNLKEMEDLREKITRLSGINSVRRYTQIGRILTKPLRETEVAQGYQMGVQIAMPLFAMAQRVKHVPVNVALNIYVQYTYRKMAEKIVEKAVKKGETMTLKAALEQVKLKPPMIHIFGKPTNVALKPAGIRGMFHLHPVRRAFRQYLSQQFHVKRAQIFAEKSLKAGGKKAAKLAAKSNLEMAKALNSMGELSKDTLKAVQVETKRTLRAGRPIGNLLNRIGFFKDGMRAAKVQFKANLGNAIMQSPVGKPIGVVQNFFSRFFEVFRKIGEKIAAFFAKIAAFFMAIIAALMIIFLFLFAIDLFAHLVMDMQTQQERFASVDADKWDEYSDKLFDMLTKKHDALKNELFEDANNYHTSDIQYPSGAKENYKEIFAALEIETQYQPGTCLTYDEMEDIASDLYDRTHTKLTPNEYTYTLADGTEMTNGAAHLYLNILRGDAICYEIFKDGTKITDQAASGGAGYAVCPVEAAPDDWISIVQAVKTAIASSGCVYNQGGRVIIEVNGQQVSVRQDCTGFVSACLALYSGAPNNVIGPNGCPVPEYSSASLAGATIEGFQTYQFSNWESLGMGDILCTAGKGHAEIFASLTDGRHWVWSNGSTASLQSAVPTVSGHASYGWVFRPNSAGSGGISTNDETEQSKASVGTMLWDENYVPPLSNTSDITFNEKTGNEDGYDTVLKTTIKSAKNSSYFTAARFRLGNKDHTLGEKTDDTTSADFIRYILSQHGVQFPFADDSMLVCGEHVAVKKGDKNAKKVGSIPLSSDTKYKAGDILIYFPSTTKLNKLILSLKDDVAINFDTLGGSSRTLEFDGITYTYDQIIAEDAVPLIYDGSKWWGYCKDITLDKNGYMASVGQVRSFNSSDLKYQRVARISRPSGFTKEPIFGSTSYFEGWTNYHIAELIEIISSPVWTDKEISFELQTTKDKSVNVTGVFADGDYESFDYSWYDESLDCFYFDGGYTWIENGHTQTFIDELASMFIRHYNENGVLPSFGSSYVVSITHNRSTEESLRFNNIFEVRLSKELQNGDSFEKYSYDDEGNSEITEEEYLKFEDYYKSFIAWLNQNKPGHEKLFKAGLYKKNIEDGTAFSNQLKAFNNAGLILDGKHEQSFGGSYLKDTELAYASSWAGYNTKKVLDKADQIAQERYELIQAVKDATKNWNDYWNKSPYRGSWQPSSLKTAEASKAEYDKMVSKVKDLEKAVNDLQAWDEKGHSFEDGVLLRAIFNLTSDGYEYITTDELNTLRAGISALKQGNEAVKNAKVLKITYTKCTGHHDDAHTDTKYDGQWAKKDGSIATGLEYKTDNGTFANTANGYGHWVLNRDTGYWSYVYDYAEKDRVSKNAFVHPIPNLSKDANGNYIKNTGTTSFQEQYPYWHVNENGTITRDANQAGNCPETATLTWVDPSRYSISDKDVQTIDDRFTEAEKHESLVVPK